MTDPVSSVRIVFIEEKNRCIEKCGGSFYTCRIPGISGRIFDGYTRI